jgi:hypothetical protein
MRLGLAQALNQAALKKISWFESKSEKLEFLKR